MTAYGEKATIGFLGPPRTNATVLHEAFRLAPPGVTWCWSTMGLPEFGQYEFDQALKLAELCAKELAAREVSIIVMTGIPLMTSKGAPYHEQLERELTAVIGGRVPVTTDINCVLAAFAALKLKKIAVASIYQRYIQDNMIRYFEHYGVRTLADEALDYALADCMTRPTMTTAYESSKRALRARARRGRAVHSLSAMARHRPHRTDRTRERHTRRHPLERDHVGRAGPYRRQGAAVGLRQAAVPMS